ncbi:MAG TPA: class I SAM-dependent methyltransferase [Puia sp.]|uniref:class I SAM-dependent methyltransferase n=1 Tax=Puia sp. TaxID=2045100 RepID=UPI002BBFB629|nr:class I SAM-dependent methyltransferase [Puia sp.]HVU98918.1 class I SAM-dependent methyltransferase [Puia sp.]
MHPLLEGIFATRQFRNSKNEIVKISSETSKGQCEYLQAIIRDKGYNRSLEIGFAYGTSTLAIVEEVAKKNGRHTVIDKFQLEGWGGNGLDLVRQAGYGDSLEFIGKFCYASLPELMSAGRRFDFAYIDSTKQLDWLLVDFFYIDKMLDPGGMIVFDDVSFPGIRKLLRYLSQFPDYRIHSQYPVNAPITGLRKAAGVLKGIPGMKKLLRPEILVSDYEMGLNAECIALEKTGEDQRRWDWHAEF